MIANSDLNTISDIAEHFATLMEISQVLTQSQTQDELSCNLVQMGLQHSGGDRCCLVLPRGEDDWHIIATATPQETVQGSIALDANIDISVQAIRYVINTQELLVLGEGCHPAMAKQLEPALSSLPGSFIGLPILHHGQLLGIFYAEHRDQSAVFNEVRVWGLKFLCSQGAIALDNLHLRHNAEQTMLSERNQSEQFEQALSLLQFKNLKLAFRSSIDTILTRSDTLSNMLQSCTDVMVEHLDAAFARIWTLNSAENMLELQASSGLYTHIDGAHSRVPVGKFKIGLIAQECRPHLTNDVVTDPRVGDKAWAKREGMVSFAGYPLMVEEDVMGVMALFARSPLPDQLIEMLAIVADEIALGISHKRVEQALDHSEDQLQQRQEELEQALEKVDQSQEKLVQSEKMVSLGNLVAGVAHEVNNPVGFLNGSLANAKDYLQDLLGHLKLYQDHYPNPVEAIAAHAEEIDLEFLRDDFPTLLQSMQGASDRIKTISNSLCTFARADSDQKVATHIHKGLDSTLLILKYRLKANSQRPAINIVRHYGSLSLIPCFPGQLNQVFMNILANAVDMFDEMARTRTMEDLKILAPSITIQTTMVSSSMVDDSKQAKQDRVEIRIRDNGKGMSSPVMEQIFDHLFTTKGVGKGTGLGLAIAHQIVTEIHGGTLTVQSEIDQGTEFCIQLPMAT